MADPGSVEDHRPHADQRAVPHRAAVQDDVVADRTILADLEGIAHVGVQRAQFLDVGAGPDDDRLVVAAKNRPEPNPDIRP